MNKYFAIASFLGATAVMIGAFGAHALKEVISPEEIESIQTAVRYQMFHVIVLLFVNQHRGFSLKLKNLMSVFLVIGVFFFSGSIYAIYLLEVSAKSIWFVTPLGGLFLIFSWILMFYFFVKKSLKKKTE